VIHSCDPTGSTKLWPITHKKTDIGDSDIWQPTYGCPGRRLGIHFTGTFAGLVQKISPPTGDQTPNHPRCRSFYLLFVAENIDYFRLNSEIHSFNTKNKCNLELKPSITYPLI